MAIAASRAGEIGIFNMEMGGSHGAIMSALSRLAHYARSPFGIKLHPSHFSKLSTYLEYRHQGLSYLILPATALAHIPLSLIHAFRQGGGQFMVEVSRGRVLSTLSDQIPLDGIWLKGHESGGIVGEESSFVLLQHARSIGTQALFVRGGAGLYSSSASYVAGAKGVVLDSALLFLDESPLSEEFKAGFPPHLSGTETTLLGNEAEGHYLRVFEKPGWKVIDHARQMLLQGRAITTVAEQLSGWENPQEQLLLIGQEILLAPVWASRHGRVANLAHAIREQLRESPSIALQQQAIAEQSPLAHYHGTTFPIVQGAMTRVSDKPGFARAVADAGALPFVALAMLKEETCQILLGETQRELGHRPWGVGLLGFTDKALQEGQFRAIEAVRPPFAYIAGGRADQAKRLEQLGITTYLHVPTPALLPLYFEQGVRHFIFEGRECGGHIGPLTSFVLWESIVDFFTTSTAIENRQFLGEVAILFAGGIHDAQSAAMVATLAAPLVAQGIKIGLLMGSAYLFTEESVREGAITATFQNTIQSCQETATLSTGPGHASRCAVTPFVESFHSIKRNLTALGYHRAEIRERLDTLTLGRLRAATKGEMRLPPENLLQPISPDLQQREGMYMIGQIAALHRDTLSMSELHHMVSYGAISYLKESPALLSPSKPASIRYPGVVSEQSARIAMIGMSTLVPKAHDLGRFWTNVLNGVDAITEVPEARWRHQDYYHEDRHARDKVYSKWGGFLGEIRFDPLFFGMPPSTLAAIDPIQLLTLLAVKQALADAFPYRMTADKERIAILLGASGGLADLGVKYAARSEILRLFQEIPEPVKKNLPEWTEDSFAGLLLNVAAGRAANRFDFGGMNCVIDAACASSLAAVYQAVNELRLGHCDLAIAGGVDTLQSPFGYFCFAKTQALSPTGRCRTFDQGADGIVISEGLATVVLKRLEEAERDGDRIYAVIQGVGASSDGRAKGLTAPHPVGQLRALRRAYAQAGYSPTTVGFFEAHGTGTVVGDNAEITTLLELMQGAHAQPGSCAVGSVKTQIGHTKAAAGVTGLIKAALALYHQVLPTHLHVKTPLPALQASDSPLYLNTQPRPWFSAPDHPHRAGVSAFGFGGTNFHIALEAYQEEYRTQMLYPVCQEWPAEAMTFAAEDRTTLLHTLQRWQKRLVEEDRITLGELAYTLAYQQPKGRYRLVVVSRSMQEFLQQLQQTIQQWTTEKSHFPSGVYWGESSEESSRGVALLFPGQGSQYVGMGRELALYLPVVRDTLTLANRLLASRLSLGTNEERLPLTRFLYPPERFTTESEQLAKEQITRTQIAQPAIGALSAGYLRWLMQLGVQGTVAVGHSFGEFTALYAAGSLTLETFLDLAAVRGNIVAAETQGQEIGGMMAVQCDWETATQHFVKIPDLTLANQNSPKQTVLSGTQESLEAARTLAQSRQIVCRDLPVAGAFHSPLMASAKERFSDYLKQMTFRLPHYPVYHNATGLPHENHPDQIVLRLHEHLIRPVRFVESIRSIHDAGVRIFLEVGPKTVLSQLVKQILGDASYQSLALEDHGGGLFGALGTLAQLWCAGVPVSWQQLFHKRHFKPISLTTPTQVGSSGWWVSGGYVRKENEPPPVIYPISCQHSTGGASASLTPIPSIHPLPDKLTFSSDSDHDPTVTEPTVIQSMEIIMTVPSRNQPVPPTVAGLDYAFAAYQETMRQFLKTQEQVMLAYLGGGTPTTDSSHSLSESMGQTVTVPTVMGDEKSDGATQREQLSSSYEKESVRNVHTTATTPEIIVPVISTVTATISPAPRGYVADSAPVSPLEMDLDSEILLAPAESNTSHDVTALLLQVASERTGYPVDMLGLDLDLEADLGIDSIKRVEILGTFQKQLPGSLTQSVQQGMGELSTLKTFGAMSQWIQQRAVSVTVTQAAKNVSGEKNRPFELTGGVKNVTPLPRYTVIPYSEPSSLLPQRLLPAGCYLVISDGSNPFHALARRIEAYGYPVRMLHPSQLAAFTEDQCRREIQILCQNHPVRAMICLSTLRIPLWQHHDSLEQFKTPINQIVKPLFLLLKGLAEDLKAGGQLIVATGMGGYLGRDCQPGEPWVRQAPYGAGLAGMVKTLTMEWNEDWASPNFWAKLVDLDLTESSDLLADHLIQELTLVGGRREVGYPKKPETPESPGERTIFRTVPASLIPTVHPLRLPDASWVVLAIGGARGITAEVLRGILPYQPTLVLIGRTPLPEPEPMESQSCSTVEALRNYFITQAKIKQERITPVEIEQKVKKWLQNREILANLKDFEASGARVDYRVVDIRDEPSVAALFENLYTQYHRIDAVYYGAGIIEDKLFVDKTRESLDRVFDTKVDGAYLLAKYLRPETLQFLALFTSVAGRYGNRGQSDYAMANETLGRMAWNLYAEWGERVKICTIHWSPWGATTHGLGMVTPETQKQFESRGVFLVEATAGREWVHRELLYGPRHEVELVAGDYRWEYDEAKLSSFGQKSTDLSRVEDASLTLLKEAVIEEEGRGNLTFRKTVDLISDPYLDHHRLDGVPVMPFAAALAYFMEAGDYYLREQGSHQTLVGVESMKLLTGISLKETSLTLVLDVDAEKDRQLLNFTLEEAYQVGRPFYQAKGLLEDDLPSSVTISPWPNLAKSPVDIDYAYRHWLFHGTVFQTITALLGYSEAGILARLRPSKPQQCYPPSLAKEWRLDPILIDGVFQLGLIWSRISFNMIPIPTMLGKTIRFGSDPLPDSLLVYVQVLSQPDELPLQRYAMVAVDDKHRVRLSIESFEMTASSALNRLGGGWAGGIPL